MKHKMWSRLLSVALAVMMIASIVPTSAFAEAASEIVAGSQAANAVQEEVNLPEDTAAEAPATETVVEEPTAEPVAEPAPTEEPVAEPSTEPAAESEQPTAEPTQAPAETAVPGEETVTEAEEPAAEPTQAPEGTETPEGTAVPGETPAPSASPLPSETPVPSESPEPSETPVPTETPEATEEPVALNEEEYTVSESVVDAENVTVTVKVPAGALPVDAKLMANRIEEETEEYAQAEAALADEALNEQPVEYDGMIALDIRFEVDGQEIEPKLPVEVTIDAKAMLPEDADPETVAVQHLEEDENGEVTAVKTVADAAEETGDVTVEETRTEEAAMDMASTFAVDGFSTFTIIWSSNYRQLEIVRIDNKGQQIGEDVSVTIRNETNVTTLANQQPIAGYGFTKAVIANSATSALWSDTEVDQLRYSTSARAWQYKTENAWRWSDISGNNKVYFIYKQEEVASSTGITFKYFTENEIDDNEAITPKDHIKYTLVLLDENGDEMTGNRLTAELEKIGAIIPESFTFESERVEMNGASFAQMGIYVPGYTFEGGYAYFYWSGNFLGQKTRVQEFRNFGGISNNYPNYISYIGFLGLQPDSDGNYNQTSSQGIDYVADEYGDTRFSDPDGYYAYNPTGTLRIVFQKVKETPPYHINYVDAYHQDVYRQIDVGEMKMYEDETLDIWYGVVDQLTQVIPQKQGYEFKGWYKSIDADGNGTGESAQADVQNQVRQHADITYYAKWEVEDTSDEYPVRFYLEGIQPGSASDYPYQDAWAKLNSWLSGGFANVTTAVKPMTGFPNLTGETGYDPNVEGGSVAGGIKGDDNVSAWLQKYGVQPDIDTSDIKDVLEKLVDMYSGIANVPVAAAGGETYTVDYIIKNPDDFKIVYTQVTKNHDQLIEYYKGNGNLRDGQDSYHVHLTIKKNPGDLLITKTFSGVSALPADFNIQVSNSVNEVIETLTVNDAIGHRANTYTWKLENLDEDIYTVEEGKADVAQMDLKATIDVTDQGTSTPASVTAKAARVKVADGQTSEVAITNTYTDASGSLQIKKVVNGQKFNDGRDMFSFKIEDENGKTWYMHVNGSGDATLDGTQGTLTLDAGKYTVTELENINYTFGNVTSTDKDAEKAGQSITVTVGGSATTIVTFTNTPKSDPGMTDGSGVINKFKKNSVGEITFDKFWIARDEDEDSLPQQGSDE